MLNNVLIVDDDPSLLLSMKTGFTAFQDTITLFTAENTTEALQIMGSADMGLVVANIKMPQMDGFELLSAMRCRFPEIPVVVTTAHRTPDMEAQIEAMGPLRILEKPIDFTELVHTVQEGLSYTAQKGSISGISVDSFLQLIEMEEKTCLLEVRNQKRQEGFFYFYQGQIYDAVCGTRHGQDAAVEMILWDNVRLDLKKLPGKRKTKQITTGLMSILMAASKIKDEAFGGGTPDFAVLTERQVDSPETIFSREDKREEKATPYAESDMTGRKPGNMEALFRDAADQMADIQIIGVADMNGRCIAAHSPVDMDRFVFAARMAVFRDKLVDPMHEMNGCNGLREAIVLTDKGWVAWCRLTSDACLCIMTGENSTRGQVQRLLDEVAGKLDGLICAGGWPPER